MRQTLQRLYQQHQQGLYTCALAVTRDPTRAEDAVHDAFARLLRREAPPAGDPAAYVFAAVRNAAIDQVRRRPKDAQASASIYREPATDDATPDRFAENVERDQLLQQAVDALPETQRLTVMLHTHAGLTFAQIAETLGAPEGTVASRYRRALEKIANSLGSLK